METKEPRDLRVVIESIIDIFPDNGQYDQARDELWSYHRTAAYTAPEAMGRLWRDCNDLMALQFTEQDLRCSSWVRVLMDVWSGRKSPPLAQADSPYTVWSEQ